MNDGLAALIDELDDGTDRAGPRIADEIITRRPDIARELLRPVVLSAVIAHRRRQRRIIRDPAGTPGTLAGVARERAELLRGWSRL
jgi:hypothetical protein